MITTTDFQKELEEKAGMKLELKFKDNRSTMLSVRWEPDRYKQAKVSLHRMFLSAPKNVMDSLACYLRKEIKGIDNTIKFFIEENIRKFDYSHLVNPVKLTSQGNYYDLKALYNTINRDYFDSKLNLQITWFGNKKRRGRTKVTFGLYYDPLKLIKIHRMMDTPSFPEYVVAYVIYHEMLHHVCPSYRDEQGIHRIHGKEFKQKEKLFHHYQLAQNWIKEHHRYLFR